MYMHGLLAAVGVACYVQIHHRAISAGPVIGTWTDLQQLSVGSAIYHFQFGNYLFLRIKCAMLLYRAG